jgi:hypothetical protein
MEGIGGKEDIGSYLKGIVPDSHLKVFLDTEMGCIGVSWWTVGMSL